MMIFMVIHKKGKSMIIMCEINFMRIETEITNEENNNIVFSCIFIFDTAKEIFVNDAVLMLTILREYRQKLYIFYIYALFALVGIMFDITD